MLIDGAVRCELAALRVSQSELRCPDTDDRELMGASLQADELAADRTLAATLRASEG